MQCRVISKMMLSLTFVLVTLYFHVIDATQNEIYLNGDDWLLSDETGRVDNIPATVPGIVHMDLLRHKIIEDPYYRFNDQKQQWTAYTNWTYTRKVRLSSEDVKDKQLMLKCDGIDTVATIRLNSVSVGYTYNYYRQWLFDITGIAKEGENTLTVTIEAAANYSTRLKHHYPYDVPAPGIYIPDTSRNFIRKPQSDFGWDWGPAYVPCGIWQNISIISYDYNVVVTTITPKPYFNDSIQSYQVEVLVCVDARPPLKDDQVTVVILSVPNTPIKEIGKVFKLPIQTFGKMCFRMSSDPVKAADMDQYLWKPRTVSNPTPLLYNATVEVTVRDLTGYLMSKVVQTRKVGFRNIRINQSPPPDKSLGSLFFFEQIDSKQSYPIYAKGSNFIPMDAFISRATPEVAKRLLQSAVMGNQNMIRIWGGGLYQPNWFYDLCDEIGILVWQEFMFAVALYPRDKEFLYNVRQEVIDTVRRIGYHPSIVLWSGNNENQGYATSTAQIIDYSLLYDSTIRTALWEEDTTRPYWPSSPSNGAIFDDKEMGIYIQRWGDSQNTSYGDIHRYDYFDLCTDVKTFPRPRFASEFGFQSYPTMGSLAKVSEPSDWSNDSPLMHHRQHHPDGNEQLVNMMKMLFKLPKNSNKTLEFEDFVYMTQVVQSICITAEAAHYRRIMSETGYTRGTLYWQLNDIWQAQSWASVEYGGRWKLLQYGMKRVYAEMFVSAYELDGNVLIYVVNDQPTKTVKCDLKVSIIKWSDGSTVKAYNSSLSSEGFTGVAAFNKSISDIFIESSTKESFLYITLTESNTKSLLSYDTYFPYNFTMFDVPKAKISISDVVIATDSKVKFSLSTDNVAPYVYLESGAFDGYFNDNGMLMMPNVQYAMTFTAWNGPVTVQKFKDNFKTRSIRDTY